MNLRNTIRAFGAAAALSLASCADNAVCAEFDDDVVVTFGTAIESAMASRSSSDTYYLQYAVFDSDGASIASLSGSKAMEADGTSSLELRLVNGQSYTIVFWADAYGNEASSPYNFDSATGSVSMIYSNVATNSDKPDAFCLSLPYKCDGTATNVVSLTRPLARINVGSTNVGDDVVASAMTISDVPSALNIVTGETSGNCEAELLAGTFTGEKIKDNEYTLLAYGYVLAPAQELAVNVSVSGAIDRTFANIPIVCNRLTNIVGNLITDPDEDPDVTVEEPTTDSDGWILIKTAAQLRYFAQKVNSGDSDYINSKARLMANINLAGSEWTPIGSLEGDAFCGDFDGNGYTISGMTVSGADGSAVDCVGLFGYLKDATVKSLTVSNGSVVGKRRVGAIVGYAVGATISGCTVTDCTVEARPQWDADGINSYTEGYWLYGDIAGGIVGEGSATSFSSNVVESCTVNAFVEGGGLYGKLSSDCSCQGNKASGVTVEQLLTRFHRFSTTVADYQSIHKVTGASDALDGNTVSDVTVRLKFTSDYSITESKNYIDVKASTCISFRGLLELLSSIPEEGYQYYAYDSYKNVTANLDFAGEPDWTPLEMKYWVQSANCVQGQTVSSSYPTIKNMTIVGDSYVGLMSINTMPLQDLNFSDITIKAKGGYAGVCAGEGRATIINCTFTNIKIECENAQQSGGFGAVYGRQSVGYLSKITVTDPDIQGMGAHVGGLVGVVDGTAGWDPIQSGYVGDGAYSGYIQTSVVFTDDSRKLSVASDNGVWSKTCGTYIGTVRSAKFGVSASVSYTAQEFSDGDIGINLSGSDSGSYNADDLLYLGQW